MYFAVSSSKVKGKETKTAFFFLLRFRYFFAPGRTRLGKDMDESIPPARLRQCLLTPVKPDARVRPEQWPPSLACTRAIVTASTIGNNNYFATTTENNNDNKEEEEEKKKTI